MLILFSIAGALISWVASLFFLGVAFVKLMDWAQASELADHFSTMLKEVQDPGNFQRLVKERNEQRSTAWKEGGHFLTFFLLFAVLGAFPFTWL